MQTPGILTFALLMLFFRSPVTAWADGGVERLRETQGPFVVTLYTPANLSAAAPTRVEVLIQRRESGAIVLDAAVDLKFIPPPGFTVRAEDVFCGPAGGVSPGRLPGAAASLGAAGVGRATHEQASNQLHYGTLVRLPVPGAWRVQVSVRQGADIVAVTGELPVGGPLQRLAALWPCLVLPPLVIVLFVMNQRLRPRYVGSLSEPVVVQQ